MMKIIDHFGLIERLNISFSEFKDPRDGKVYQTVKIGDTEWFRDNLNFDDTKEFEYMGIITDIFGAELPSIESESYYGCGRLYSFHSAQEACPEGWEIPKRGEFIDLFTKITQKPVNEWKEEDRAMIFYTFYGKNSIMNAWQCGSYDFPSWTPDGEKRKREFLKETGKANLFTSTPGSLKNGGSVFTFRADHKSYYEDVRYGYYPVRPIRKNI